MIYFQHSETKVIYKAYTLRKKFISQWNGCGYTEFDPVIASIMYGNISSLWSKENRVMQFLDDYEILIPYHNVFGVKAGEIIMMAK